MSAVRSNQLTAASAWLEGRALGMHHALAAAAPAMVELYRGMGIELRELGAARPHHGEDRVPVAVRVSVASWATEP